MNSIRYEDIFEVHERNRNHYINCETIKYCKNNCSCHINQLVYPKTIGNNDFKRKLNNKMYIWTQDRCVICLYNIGFKSNAYLSDCGHSFHKKCLTNYYHYIKMISNKNFKCPLCRSNLGSPDFNTLYNSLHKDFNSLDMLETINININDNYLEMIHICKGIGTSKKHYLGLNSNCKYCLNYRENGTIN